MKINFIKLEGGTLIPFSQIESDRMIRFKNREVYQVEIKTTRNPAFHRKVFSFLNYCFENWSASNCLEFVDESKQFDYFRKMMIIKAGYYDQFFDIDGNLRLEAKSISYANMNQEEFENLYNALIQVAMSNIFKTNDKDKLNKLYNFFN
jgi:hypothetical protein